ncbi:hypothetical protein VH567_07685 [Sphingomonas sp. 4RDLI-65]|uniref:hypothetical protein n=1 Tax=Sphingomonas sp. 4RDLI-65 TaxID=3111641 RepID=UPI003C1E9110
MRRLMMVAMGCCMLAAAIAAEAPAGADAAAPAGASAGASAGANAGVLVPAHTEVVLRLNEEVGSDRARLGQMVPVSVARDVVVDGAILIPRGTAGTGEVVYRSGKGAFGKSGKVDVELRSIDVGGRSVPVVGRYHAAGGGRTGETIGTIIVGGVIAGAFITGRHAVFEEGHEFTAFTGAATRVARPSVRMARFVPPAASMPSGAGSFAPATVSYRPRPISPYVARPAPAVVPAYTVSGSLAERLAAAQPVRGGDPRLGWTISD